jgi:hypothetical protein
MAPNPDPTRTFLWLPVIEENMLLNSKGTCKSSNAKKLKKKNF